MFKCDCDKKIIINLMNLYPKDKGKGTGTFKDIIFNYLLYTPVRLYIFFINLS